MVFIRSVHDGLVAITHYLQFGRFGFEPRSGAVLFKTHIYVLMLVFNNILITKKIIITNKKKTD